MAEEGADKENEEKEKEEAEVGGMCQHKSIRGGMHQCDEYVSSRL